MYHERVITGKAKSFVMKRVPPNEQEVEDEETKEEMGCSCSSLKTFARQS